MDYTSDSDLSDDTRELVNQGLASVKRKRRIIIAKSSSVHDRGVGSIMDTSNVRHPSRYETSIGDTSTHGMLTAGAEFAICQNHNIGTAEVGLEVVEPRSARRESSRRQQGEQETTNDEMRTAYDKLEREMNELRNNMGKRTNPSDTEIMNAWRERVEFARAEAFGDLKERASKLAESARRVRERRYAGARVIEVTPVREVAPNVNAADAQGGSTTTGVHKTCGEMSERAEISRRQTKTLKTEPENENKTIKKERKEKIGRSDTKAKSRTGEKKVKIAKKIRETSTSDESSGEDDEDTTKRTSRNKDKRVKSRRKKNSSDSEEDIKKPKKVEKNKMRKNKDKVKKMA